MNNLVHTQTRLAQSAIATDSAHGAVIAPLYLSSNYAWDDPKNKPSYDYSRSGNPTRDQLEAALCGLEAAAKGVITSSGMAAVDLALSLARPDDLVLAPHDCYGGSHRLLSARSKRGHFKVEFVDQSDETALRKAFARRPKLILIETPSNPLLRITDIELCVRLAKKFGTLTIVDNTFLSPALQQPLKLGADMVVHSTTKFINGHSDVVGGALLARDPAIGDELAWWANCTGITGAPFDSFMTLRGVRTLFLRTEQQQESAAALIHELKQDSRIRRIFYPALKTHPGHEIAARQQTGFGSMFSVEFSSSVDVLQLLRETRIFTVAESLGGFESLICVPAIMTHASMSAEAQKSAGISKTLVRFSIGLEHTKDLIADIKQALGKAVSGSI